LLDRTDYQSGHCGYSQIRWAGALLVQQPVHAHECLSRAQTCGKQSAWRKAIVQTESDKQRLSDHVEMRKAAIGDLHHRVVLPANQPLKSLVLGGLKPAAGL